MNWCSFKPGRTGVIKKQLVLRSISPLKILFAAIRSPWSQVGKGVPNQVKPFFVWQVTETHLNYHFQELKRDVCKLSLCECSDRILISSLKSSANIIMTFGRPLVRCKKRTGLFTAP